MTEPMTETTTTLTAGERRLIKAIHAVNQPKVMVLVDGRKPWRLVRGGPGWKAETFCSLANRGYLRIEYGFAGRADVALTAAGRALADGRTPARCPDCGGFLADDGTCRAASCVDE
jgi:hypothetical protein